MEAKLLRKFCGGTGRVGERREKEEWERSMKDGTCQREKRRSPWKTKGKECRGAQEGFVR